MKPSKPCARTIGCWGVAGGGQLEATASYYLRRRTVAVSEDGIFIANDSSQGDYSWILGQGGVVQKDSYAFTRTAAGNRSKRRDSTLMDLRTKVDF